MLDHHCLRTVVAALPLLFSEVAIGARGDDRPEHNGSGSFNGEVKVFRIPVEVVQTRSHGAHFVGDFCHRTCSAILQHAFCNTTSQRCECSPDYPVVIDSRFCERASQLDELCRYDKVCQFTDQNSECGSPTKNQPPVCRCRPHYERTPFHSGEARFYCVRDPLSELLEPDTPTVLGLLLGLVLMTCLICLVLRLFYRARHARARGYGDASLPPPLSLSEVSTPASQRFHRCSPEPVRWNGAVGPAALLTPSDTAVMLNEPAPDLRRYSNSSVHSSFSTCTYGLPEAIVAKLKAQRKSQQYQSQQLPQEEDSLETSSLSLGPVRDQSLGPVGGRY